MRKNGFTFIEILGVITLLALLSIIVLTVVDKNLKDSKNTLSEVQIESIKSAASMWRTDNIELIPDSGYYVMTLGNLIDLGYLKSDIIDPQNKEKYDLGMLIDVGINEININNEYRALHYIESTGTQYITTSIVPSNDMGIMLKVSSMSVSNDLIYLGSRKDSSIRFWIGNVSSRLYYGWNAVTTSQNRPAISLNTMYLVKMNYLNDRNASINDQIVHQNLEQLGDNDIPITIFSGNNGTAVSYKSSIKLYELKISSGTSVIHNFIPCIRSIDDEVGLYDSVERIFYTNSGTGDFLYGELE